MAPYARHRTSEDSAPTAPTAPPAAPRRGAGLGGHDFEWDSAPEPHATRRRAILAKYGPAVRALYGPHPAIIAKVALCLAVQLTIASVAAELPLWAFMLVAYTIGGVTNHCLTLAMHEVSHNLAFKSFAANKVFGIVTNLPLGVPAFA